MYQKIRASVLAITCFLVAGCEERVASIAGCEADGTSAVLNRGAGEWENAGNQPQLTELWRSNPQNTEERFGFPAALAASRSGRLAVADFELDRVSVFADDGQLLGLWPTDHRLAKPVAVSWDEHEQLHVFDLGASAILITDADGKLLRTHPISESFLEAAMGSAGLAWAGVLPSGSVYYQPLAELTGEAEDPGQSLWTLWSQRTGGERVDTIAEAPARLFGYTMIARLPVPMWPQLRAATGGSGILAMGGEDGAYRIRLLREDGSPVRTVCRDAEPLPLSAQERGEGERESVTEMLREVPQPATPASYGHFFLSADDQLWVQRDRPFTAGSDPYASVHGNAGGLFDVFDPQGRYLGELRAPMGARLRTAAGDRVWGIHAEEGGATQVAAYQLVIQ